MIDITARLDAIASELEHVDPRLSLILDQVSDRLARGYLPPIGELVDEVHEYFGDFIATIKKRVRVVQLKKPDKSLAKELAHKQNYAESDIEIYEWKEPAKKYTKVEL